MGLDTFLLLLAFGLTKIGLAATIIWLGFRSGERPDDGEDWRPPKPVEPPPGRPSRRRPARAAIRGGPARSRAPGRPVRA